MYTYIPFGYTATKTATPDGPTMWGGIEGDINLQTDLTSLIDTKENYLGLPAFTNAILTSTSNGVRSWVELDTIMSTSVYDTDQSGVVDNAELVNGLSVGTTVPVGAVFTDTTYVSSDFDHDALTNYIPEEHIDWAAAQIANIHPSNYTDTTYVSSDFDHNGLTNYAPTEHIDWTLPVIQDIHPDNYTDTDTTYVSSDFDHNALTNYVAEEHIDWAASQITNIHPDNYTDTDTTYDGTNFLEHKTLLTSLDNLDTTIANGMYGWLGATASPINAPASYCSMIVDDKSGQPVQTVFGGSVTQTIYIRRRDSGIWTTWTDLSTGGGGDADTLDGLDSTQFLRSDADDTATGSVNFNNKLQAKGFITGQSTSGAALQVNGFQRTGGLIIHSGATGAILDDGLWLDNIAGDISWNGNKLWSSANDGAGSGLDADTLDGRDGADYARATDVLSGNVDDIKTPGLYRINNTATNLPVAGRFYAAIVYGNGGNVTGQQFTDYVTGETWIRGFNSGWSAWRKQWDSSNDGAGSGLDADTLDGKQGSAYIDTPLIEVGSNGSSGLNHLILADCTITIAYGALAETIEIESRYLSGTINILLNGSSTPVWLTNPVITFSGNSSDIANNYIWWKLVASNRIQVGVSSGAYNSYTKYKVLTSANISCTVPIRATAWSTETGVSHNTGLSWNSSNDGSGSGLDADNLDGYTWGNVGTALLPSGGNTINLGSSTYYWANMYTSNARIAVGDGKGFSFWNSDSYKIYMAHKSNNPMGVVNEIDTGPDYNTYFRMTGALHRGWVFHNETSNSTAACQITGDGRVFARSAVSGYNYISTAPTGTAPLTVASTTKVTNLNADFLDGYSGSSLSVALTYSLRDGNGDINARLFKSNYAEQTTAPAATADICFRNSTTDDFMRFMTRDAARSYLGVEVGSVVNTITYHTRTQASLYLPSTGAFVELSYFRQTFTPKKAGNKVILDFQIFGEGKENVVYVVTRNDVPLSGATDVSGATGNKWSGISINNYDGNDASTPASIRVLITDFNCLSVSSTYKLLIRSSTTSASNYYLNRTYLSAGQNLYESGLSSLVIQEIGV